MQREPPLLDTMRTGKLLFVFLLWLLNTCAIWYCLIAVQQVQLELAKLRDASKRQYFAAAIARKRFGVKHVQQGTALFDEAAQQFFDRYALSHAI
jgi:hypothetical protein